MAAGAEPIAELPVAGQGYGFSRVLSLGESNDLRAHAETFINDAGLYVHYSTLRKSKHGLAQSAPTLFVQCLSHTSADGSPCGCKWRFRKCKMGYNF